MIKEYVTIKNVYGKSKKIAIVICDSCGKEFQVPERVADGGRKYCSRECMYNDKGFGVKLNL